MHTLIKNVFLLNFADELSMTFLKNLKKTSSYKLTGGRGLEIYQVYAKKIEDKVFVNQQNSVS